MDNQKLKAAIAVVRSEMHAYDGLASKPRYRVEAPHRRDSARALDIDAPQKCAHGTWLHEQCDKCGRYDLPWSDCVPYRQAREQRLKELLKAIS